jgi:post-segregation antitoxin (ccd killing protein)
MTRKRRVNPTLNEDLVQQAKGLTEKQRLIKAKALAATIATWNDFNSKIGSFSDEYCPL